MINCTINGKSATLNLSNKQLQVLLTGKFGDGYLSTPISILQIVIIIRFGAQRLSLIGVRCKSI